MASSTEFTFIIPVYNCEHKIRQTLMSVLSQSYENWKVLLRDDLSTDNTVNVINDFIKKFDMSNRISLTINKEKHEVICRLDGGDWLTDNDTLSFLDHVYRQHDPACAWTAHRWAYTNKNISGPLPENCNPYRDLLDNWCTSHMKTWRKSSMNEINDTNYRDENDDYIMIACDRAIYLPILQKAKNEGKKALFIPLCCYHYSIDLGKKDLFTEDRSIKQRKSAEFIHNRGYIE